jgi:hypothetical protein
MQSTDSKGVCRTNFVLYIGVCFYKPVFYYLFIITMNLSHPTIALIFFCQTIITVIITNLLIKILYRTFTVLSVILIVMYGKYLN